MVRLPVIDTGERTLCQDKSTHPSSFWLSVAKKDYGEVYRRPASDQPVKVYRPEAEIKTWTYHYSPRSKAPYWDWHYEKPVDKSKTDNSTTTPKSKDASTQDFWSPGVSPTDLVPRSDGNFDYLRDYSDPGEYAKYLENGGQDSILDAGRRAGQYNQGRMESRSRGIGSSLHVDDKGQPETEVRRQDERQEARGHDDFGGRYARSDDTLVTSLDPTPGGNDQSYLRRSPVRGKVDKLDLDLERQRYHDNSGAGTEDAYKDGSDPGDNERRANESWHQENKPASYKYKTFHPERYVSETMDSYKFRRTPRVYNPHAPKEAAIGIVPANEFYDPDPFERMLPKCDRESTVKMATFPVMGYGRKKKHDSTPTEHDVILPDPSPLDYVVYQDKSSKRKKYIPGPPDCLKVPGFDGGAPFTDRPTRKQANYADHRSKRTEIQIG